MLKKVNPFYSKMPYKIIRVFELQDPEYLGLILEPQFYGSPYLRYRVNKEDSKYKEGDILKLSPKTMLNVLYYYQVPICAWRFSLENEKNLRCKLCGEGYFSNAFAYNSHIQRELNKKVQRGKLSPELALDAFFHAYREEEKVDFSPREYDIYT